METDYASFHKYSSIDNPTSKMMRHLEKHGYLDDTVEWIAQEKIHGSNFSFIIEDEIVRIAKRSGLIRTDENFNHCDIVQNKYRDDVIEIFHRIKNDIGDVKSIQIYGELFGGYYPNMKNEYCAVQKGVYYYHGIDFMVFDIRINIINGETYYLSQDEVDYYLQLLPQLRGVPISNRGKFSELIKLDPIFQTTIPMLYDLSPLEDNQAEGYVLKVNARHVCAHFRPIIKHKNKKFDEVMKHVKKIPEGDNCHDLVLRSIPYCTQNRFNNIISKFGMSEPLGRLQGFYIVDVLEDLEKELDADELIQFKKIQKKIKSALVRYLMSGGQLEIWLHEYQTPMEDQF